MKVSAWCSQVLLVPNQQVYCLIRARLQLPSHLPILSAKKRKLAVEMDGECMRLGQGAC